MKINLLGAVGAIAVLLATSPVYAGSMRYKGAGGCTFTNTSITFDGVNFASISTCTGSDNFGLGQGQSIGAYYDTGSSCTAPDGTPGTVYVLEFATDASTYQLFNDQLWSYSLDGTSCSSDTTGVFKDTTTFTVSGGTGRFSNATGTVNDVAIGSYLYAAQPSTEQTGYFGRFTFSNTGSVTP